MLAAPGCLEVGPMWGLLGPPGANHMRNSAIRNAARVPRLGVPGYCGDACAARAYFACARPRNTNSRHSYPGAAGASYVNITWY